MNIRSPIGAAFSFAACLAATPASAQVPTTVTVDVPAVLQAGDGLDVVARMHVKLDQCPANPIGGTLTFTTSSGTVRTGVLGGDRKYLSCANGVYSDGYEFGAAAGRPGTFAYTVDYSGSAGIGSSSTGPVNVQVVDAFSGTVAQGAVKLNVSQVPSEFSCSMHTASISDGAPPAAPAGLSFPTGYATYAFTGCQTACNGFCPPPPDDPMWAGQVVTMQLPQPPAPGSKVWVYAPGGGMTTPVWRRIEPQVDGSTVKFVLTGNGGESELRGVLALASGDGGRSDLQDLWWGGPQENGWGVGISQIGDRMFVGMFLYGLWTTAGSPAWLVMPGGSWDASHTTFIGDVYVPSGSSYLDYHANQLSVGQPVLKGKLTFNGSSSARLELVDRAGTAQGKTIVRQPFGTSPEPGPFAGLWWGGAAQNGWGMSLAQQGDTLFAVWYTYDEFGGNPVNTWFVMPGGAWTSRTTFGGTYEGTLYRTRSANWGADYDPSKLAVTPAGTLTLDFFASDLARMKWTVDGVEGENQLYKQPF